MKKVPVISLLILGYLLIRQRHYTRIETRAKAHVQTIQSALRTTTNFRAKSTSASYPTLALNVAHYSNHVGAIRDLEYIFSELGVRHKTFLLLKYDVTQEWAQQYYDDHADEINSYDIIFTSDTPPLSRIFLQNLNTLQPRIVVWVCNRFDYKVWGDKGYYSLLNSTLQRHDSKVLFIPYTEYEKVDSRYRLGIDIDKTSTITPHGLQLETEVFQQKAKDLYGAGSPAPLESDFKPIFITRYENDQVNVNVPSLLKHGNIPHISGAYAHPKELQRYAAVITFPDAMSKFLTFETIQYGIPVILPSMNWLRRLASSNYWLNGDNLGGQPLTEYWFQNEWYRFPECRIFVDDVQELVEVARQLSAGNYPNISSLHTMMANRADQIHNTNLRKWQIVLAASAADPHEDIYGNILRQDEHSMHSCMSKHCFRSNAQMYNARHTQGEFDPETLLMQSKFFSYKKVFHLMIASHTGTKVIVDLRSDKTPSHTSRVRSSRRNMFTHIAADCNQHVDGLRIVVVHESQEDNVHSYLGANRHRHFVTTQRQPAFDFIINYDGPLITVLYTSFQDGTSEYSLRIVKLLAARRHDIFAAEAFILIDDVTTIEQPEDSVHRTDCIWGNEPLCFLTRKGWYVTFKSSQWILKAP